MCIIYFNLFFYQFYHFSDLLFNRLWDGVELIEPSCNIYLECLKNYLFDGQFDEVPTIIIQKLFSYLSQMNQLEVFNFKFFVYIYCLRVDITLFYRNLKNV